VVDGAGRPVPLDSLPSDLSSVDSLGTSRREASFPVASLKCAPGKVISQGGAVASALSGPSRDHFMNPRQKHLSGVATGQKDLHQALLFLQGVGKARQIPRASSRDEAGPVRTFIRSHSSNAVYFALCCCPGGCGCCRKL